MNDQELKDTILNILRDDTRVDVREVQVEVDSGAVCLRGSVDSAAERKAVVEDAETIPGVRRVLHDLRLRNFVPRSEEELREEVKLHLMRDPYVDPANIEIHVHGTEVTLEGSVRTYAEKTAAESVAWWTPGVTNVISNLYVTEQKAA